MFLSHNVKSKSNLMDSKSEICICIYQFVEELPQGL